MLVKLLNNYLKHIINYNLIYKAYDFGIILYLYSLKIMFIFKRTMRKYLSLLFIAISFVSFAQFQDNVFEQDKSTTLHNQSDVNNSTKIGTDTQVDGTQSSSAGPGNPGPEPVLIDGFLPFLFLTGLVFIIYYREKSKKINI
ncbi:hypothetical protein [Epilithonimonas sp.]|uniref:hypothetical protein n=1 Tax=Epilithonimonas sp. TaxID=2894511 RepID=UPI002899FAE9|nr:hypothetical protein [Epilithonimonas sp.]